MKPHWMEIAQGGDLTPEALLNDAADLRLDQAFSNLSVALCNAVEALERHDHPELAEQLAESFLRAFRVQK